MSVEQAEEMMIHHVGSFRPVELEFLKLVVVPLFEYLFSYS